MTDSHGEVPFPDDIKKVADTSNSPLPDVLRRLAGATGRFPQSKLNEADEGELRFLVAHVQGQVILEFNKPVTWVGFGRHTCLALIEALQHHADAV